MRVDLEPDADSYPPADAETLWATPTDDPTIVRIESIPVFVENLAVGDEVLVHRDNDGLVFDGIIQSAGNSALSIVVEDDFREWIRKRSPRIRPTFTSGGKVVLAVGDKIPDIELKTMGPEGAPVSVRTGEVLGKGKVVLFAVPGAFTPGCSRVHLPGFVSQADELKAKGVDTIACVAVNDAWVMEAWGKAHDVGDKILLLADGSGDFTRAMDLVMDGTGFGLGLRSKRYAAVIEDGIITQLNVEETGGISVSSCESVLASL